MAFLSWNCFYFLIFFRGSFVKWTFFRRRHVVDVFAFGGELGTGFLLYTIEFLRFNC